MIIIHYFLVFGLLVPEVLGFFALLGPPTMTTSSSLDALRLEEVFLVDDAEIILSPSTISPLVDVECLEGLCRVECREPAEVDDGDALCVRLD